MLADTLKEVLAGLKREQRPVVELRLQGYPIEEIARQVGCTERTVQRVLEKARTRLTQQCADGS